MGVQRGMKFSQSPRRAVSGSWVRLGSNPSDNFIKEMTMLPAYKKTLMNEVDRWAEAETNGRKIRNIILMAENLAASDKIHPRLLPKYIDEILNVTLEFCDYNRESTAMAKTLQLTGPSY